MKEDNVLQVYYEEKRVGILALTADHKAAFQYDEKWLENGFSISPFTNKRLFFRSFWSVCRQSSG